MHLPRSLVLAALIAGVAGGASAQSAPELRLPQELDRAFRDMMESMKPTLDDALDLMRNFNVIDDPRNYQMPELLPNGDIILRRRPDAPAYVPEPPEETPEKPDAPVEDNVKI